MLALPLDRLARAYDIGPFWDYDRPGSGLLLANGTGTMLAAMDEIPGLRWCVDLTGLRVGPALDRWLEFAAVCRGVCSFVCASLVCFADKPEPLVDLLASFDSERLAVYSNAELHATAQREWPEFVARANALASGLCNPSQVC